MPEKIGDWLTRPEIEEKRRVIEDLIVTGRKDNKNGDHYRDALKDKIRAGLMDKKFYLELLTKFKVPYSNKTLQKIWGNIEIMANVLIPKMATENEENETVVTDETMIEEEEEEKWTTPQNILEIDDVLLPTEKGEKGIQPGDTGDYNAPRLYPRAHLLHQLLKDSGLTESDYLVIKGNNKYIKKYGEQREMVRQTSYQMFIVPDLEKMIFVCDEENNATFIIHEITDPEKYYTLSKNTLQQKPLVEKVEWHNNNEEWKETILEVITRQHSTSKADDKEEKTKEILEKAPGNWMNIRQIAKNLGKSAEYVKKEIEKYFEQHPEVESTHKKPLLDTTNKAVTHYAPEIIAWVKKVMEKLPEKATENWRTHHQLMVNLGKSKEYINKKIKEYFEQHPEVESTHKKPLLVSSNNIVTHYSPEVVEWIKEATKQLPEKAYENWMNNGQIARKLGKSKNYVKKEILKYFEQHPEEESTHKKPLLDAANNIVDHYSPEIIAWVKKAMEQLPEKAPEGWMNALQLTIYLGKSKDFLIKKVKKYFEQHPEKIDTYKKHFLDSGSRITIFYSPEIVVWLKKEVG